MLAVGALAALGAAATADRSSFHAWALRHGRKYASAEEEERRFGHYLANMAEAERMRQRNPRATFGETAFSDWSADEFERRRNNRPLPAHSANMTVPKQLSAAEIAHLRDQEKDWRKLGAVSPVKDQGHCGSCWAFSASGASEGAWVVGGNKLVSVSADELVECVTTTCSSTCTCGDPTTAGKWIVSNGGVNSDQAYPYTYGNCTGASCVHKCGSGGSTTADAVTLKSYDRLCGWGTSVKCTEDSMLAKMLEVGPISICLDDRSLLHYTGGIMTSCEFVSQNHCILLVGYAHGSPNYWIAKNSWGASWGEEGYARVQFGTDQCGLTHEVSYATA